MFIIDTSDPSGGPLGPRRVPPADRSLAPAPDEPGPDRPQPARRARASGERVQGEQAPGGTVQRLADRPWGTGIFRRQIRLAVDGAVVEAALADDYQRFALRLVHDGTTIVAVEADTVRIPWTACPGAAVALRALEGQPLAALADPRAHGIDPRQHCTHLFDLVTLVAAHARDDGLRRFDDIAVPDRRDGATRATLWRDGAELLTWDVVGDQIVAPEPFAGRHLSGSFAAWATGALEADRAEAAIVLRRATLMGSGRSADIDDAARASDYAGFVGSCFTFQPERVEGARRRWGSAWDFTDDPGALLADDQQGGSGS